jgi:hypothetical protein
MEEFLPEVQDGVQELSGSFEELVYNVRSITAVIKTITLPLRILFNGLQILGSTIAGGFMQMINMAKGLFSVLVSLGNAFNRLVDLAVGTVNAVKNANMDMLPSLRETWDGFLSDLREGKKGADEAIKEHMALYGEWKSQVDKHLGDIGYAMYGVDEAWRKTTEGIKRAGPLALGGTGAMGADAKAQAAILAAELARQAELKRKAQAAILAAEQAKEAALNRKAQAAILKDTQAWLDEMATRGQDTIDMNRRVWEMIREDTLQNLDRMATEGQVKLDQLRDAAVERFQQMASFASQFGDAFGHALVAAFDPRAGALKEQLKRMLIMILGFIQRLVIAAKIAAVTAAIIKGGPLNPAAMARAIAGIAMISSLFGALKAAVASFAVGTKRAPGGPALLHRGEMAVLPRGTQVLTAAEARNVMHNRAAFTFNVSIGAVTQETLPVVQEDLRQLGRRIVEAYRGGYFRPSEAGLLTR